MRAIKFRVWDIRHKEMTYPDLFWFEEEGIREVPEDARGYEIMQFTGLTDRHGKEIWEGDIVTGDKRGTLDEVIFTSGCFCLKQAMLFYEATYWGSEIEIVGNIYEQPELLQKAGEA